MTVQYLLQDLYNAAVCKCNRPQFLCFVYFLYNTNVRKHKADAADAQTVSGLSG